MLLVKVICMPGMCSFFQAKLFNVNKKFETKLVAAFAHNPFFARNKNRIFNVLGTKFTRSRKSIFRHFFTFLRILAELIL